MIDKFDVSASNLFDHHWNIVVETSLAMGTTLNQRDKQMFALGWAEAFRSMSKMTNAINETTIVLLKEGF